MYRRLFALASCSLMLLAGCGGGGGGSSSIPAPVSSVTPAPTPTPTATPVGTPAGYAGCPSVAPLIASAAPPRTAMQRYMPVPDVTQRSVQGLFAVTYAQSAQQRMQTAEQSAQLRVVRHLQFAELRTAGDILSAEPSRIQTAMAAMRAQPGVQGVSQISYRHPTSASALPDNDPYYNGFGPGAPYFESASVPGQWDMHVINVAQAWGYSQSNTTGLTFNGAVQGAPIAIVDTGVDTSAYDLNGAKIVLTKCFVTWNGTQTTGSDATDMDGHGTEMAGIAAADTNNAAGVAGVGHNSLLLIYRVYPSDPPGGCRADPQNVQCQTTSADVASAVNDAVTNGARVISLSMAAAAPAGQTCAQSDPLESNAIENAIAGGVTVVAAAGNDGKAQIDCPAGNSGVIAVGASALNDSNPANITEYVPSYSNYGSGNFWGIVAPGGDPSSSSDSDDLHWIINLHSRVAVDLPASGCAADYQGNAMDCIAADAGTSQAAAHVAGAAALIAGAKPIYTPSEIFGMLCSGADNIGDAKQGCGRLDVYRALAAAVHDPSP